MMTRLVTERLMMRRAQPADFDGYLALASHFDVVKMTASWKAKPDHDQIRERCKPVAPENGMVGPVFHAGQMVGAMGINSKNGEPPELGYMFAPDHWGKGFATEMATALIAHVWDRYDWDEIYAGAYDDNPASLRVLKKLGFEKTGESKIYSAARGEEVWGQDFRLPRP